VNKTVIYVVKSKVAYKRGLIDYQEQLYFQREKPIRS